MSFAELNCKKKDEHIWKMRVHKDQAAMKCLVCGFIWQPHQFKPRATLRFSSSFKIEVFLTNEGEYEVHLGDIPGRVSSPDLSDIFSAIESYRGV